MTMDHLTRSLKNGLVSESLHRWGIRRDDPIWIRERLSGESTYLLPVFEHKNLVIKHDDRVAVARVEPRRLAEHLTTREDTVFLGEHGQRYYFALSVSGTNQPLLREMERLGEFADLRAVGPFLSDVEGALLAYARGMIHWHRYHRFCGTCGSETVSEKSGHVRVCAHADCGAVLFPRTDPAIIVLVDQDDECLLGRQPSWPQAVYSTIAGFVEPGETLEHAVVREVDEETGVRVASVQYHSSQPWPFPSSVMIGFLARAASRAIVNRDGELEDVGWFSRREVGDAISGRGNLRVPPAFSIARRLIEDWYHESRR
ncbi:MAG: NAD(+) diphosphatase [Gammaproteobacteria bacterium]|nr:NAD(+) diphosphatase [Gammaproteobacteria bacterium]